MPLCTSKRTLRWRLGLIWSIGSQRLINTSLGKAFSPPYSIGSPTKLFGVTFLASSFLHPTPPSVSAAHRLYGVCSPKLAQFLGSLGRGIPNSSDLSPPRLKIRHDSLARVTFLPFFNHIIVLLLISYYDTVANSRLPYREVLYIVYSPSEPLVALEEV